MTAPRFKRDTLSKGGLYFAFVHCEACGSSFGSGEWMRDKRQAHNEALESFEGHYREWHIKKYALVYNWLN